MKLIKVQKKSRFLYNNIEYSVKNVDHLLCSQRKNRIIDKCHIVNFTFEYILNIDFIRITYCEISH